MPLVLLIEIMDRASDRARFFFDVALEHLARSVSRAVVHNDDFVDGVGLCQDAINGILEQMATIISRNYSGDGGHSDHGNPGRIFENRVIVVSHRSLSFPILSTFRAVLFQLALRSLELPLPSLSK